jgi:uncharacterized repeat protein (TIGR01451 family)
MGDGFARRTAELPVAIGVAAVLVLLTLATEASRGATSPAADLSVAKTDSPDPVSTGAALTYAITVTNVGPDTATNVVVTDTLPSGVAFVSAQTTQGNCTVSGNKRKVTCKLGTIPLTATPVYVPGGPNYTPGGGTITINALAPAKPGAITNTATVAGSQKDPKKGNNSAKATTRVLAPVTPTCGGRAASVIGTPGEDVLTGTAGNDVILALASGDRIRSLGGRDLICAGAGADVVKSGGGADSVRGGPGADRLIGSGGGDKLRGGGGPDRIRGGRGADLLAGGRGRDRCFGGPGIDILRGC